jgi:PhzF family phenazine biosynthesis protein
MPRYLDYVTLDVFTPVPFAGNQLGVVFLPDDPASVSQGQKQQIAREFNYSETIFIHPVLADSPNRRRFDIFMTDRELPFAGHPTIGAASWLLCLAPDVSQSLSIDTLVAKAGDITISLLGISDRIVSASIPFDAHLHKARYPLSELLRLYPSLSPAFSTMSSSATRDFPVFSIVKGVNQLLIDLPNLEALESLSPAVSGEEVPTKTASQGGYLDENWGGEGIVAVYFYVRDVQDKATNKPVIRTRMIDGALEDAATGSAASGLAAYLSLIEPNSEGKCYDYDIVQGVEMDRRSEIGAKVVRATDGPGIASIVLRGTAVKICAGQILVKEES